MLPVLTFAGIASVCPTAYAFLKDKDLSSLPTGRYDLEDGVFLNVISYDAKDRALCKYEAHLRYVDLQFILSGSECIAVAPVKELAVTVPYDEEKDLVFYADDGKGDLYRLDGGMGLLLLPEDGHMPGIAADAEKPAVKKIVVKIPV